MKQDIAEASRTRMRQEAERDAAQRALEKCLEVLRDDFGIDTKQEAQAALEVMESDLEELVGQIEEALEASQ